MIPNSPSSAKATTTTTTSTTTRGAFIVLEGVDRCGKTTQVQRLVQRFVSLGVAAAAWRFPDRTTATGQIIHQYLQSSSRTLSDEAVHLLFSANRWEAAADLRATLQAGTHVVCDRYAFSGVAFSAAKPGMGLAWCRAPDVGLPAPDGVIFLDVDPAKAEGRGGYGEERYETKDFQASVRRRFGELQDIDEDQPWHIVDAGQTIDEVEQDIWNVVENVVQDVKDKPIGKLWQTTNDDDDNKTAATESK